MGSRLERVTMTYGSVPWGHASSQASLQLSRAQPTPGGAQPTPGGACLLPFFVDSILSRVGSQSRPQLEFQGAGKEEGQGYRWVEPEADGPESDDKSGWLDCRLFSPRFRVPAVLWAPDGPTVHWAPCWRGGMSRNGVLGQGGRPGGKEGLLRRKMSTHSSRDSRRWLWRTVARFLSITETLRSQTRLAGVGEASEDPTQHSS